MVAFDCGVIVTRGDQSATEHALVWIIWRHSDRPEGTRGWGMAASDHYEYSWAKMETSRRTIIREVAWGAFVIHVNSTLIKNVSILCLGCILDGKTLTNVELICH